MRCNFCENPAGHPATGCQYGDSMFACAECTRSFWKWARAHFNKKPRRGSSPETSVSFYEAAAKDWQKGTFVRAVLEGTACLEDVGDWVDAWHESDSEASLGGFLGLTHDQYAKWVENPKSLAESVESWRRTAIHLEPTEKSQR